MPVLPRGGTGGALYLVVAPHPCQWENRGSLAYRVSGWTQIDPISDQDATTSQWLLESRAPTATADVRHSLSL